MRTWLTIAAAGILAIASQGAAQSADLTALTGMGNFSGVRDLAEPFSKATWREVIGKLRIADRHNPKTNFTGGGPVAECVARGEIGIGLQQNSVLINGPGSEFVAAIPASIDKPCPFSLAVLKVTTNEIVARAFV